MWNREFNTLCGLPRSVILCEGKAEPTKYDVQYDRGMAIGLLYLDVLCYSIVKCLTLANPCNIQQKQYSVLIGGLHIFLLIVVLLLTC